MNYEEIKLKLTEIGITANNMGEYGLNDEVYDYQDEDEKEFEEILEENFGNIEIVEKSYQHDGHECWCVYYFKDHNVYIKYEGYFSSYDPTNFRRITEVFPEEKTIIVYNGKKA